MKSPPDGVGIESGAGVKENLTENAMAVTTVGDARKFIVDGFPSFRDLKFLFGLSFFPLMR